MASSSAVASNENIPLSLTGFFFVCCRTHQSRGHGNDEHWWTSPRILWLELIGQTEMGTKVFDGWPMHWTSFGWHQTLWIACWTLPIESVAEKTRRWLPSRFLSVRWVHQWGHRPESTFGQLSGNKSILNCLIFFTRITSRHCEVFLLKDHFVFSRDVLITRVPPRQGPRGAHWWDKQNGTNEQFQVDASKRTYSSHSEVSKGECILWSFRSLT